MEEALEKETSCLTEYSKMSKMRKIEILRKVPFSKWHKDELIDFIQHYLVYFNNNRESYSLVNIDEFLILGEYKKYYNKHIEHMKKM